MARCVASPPRDGVRPPRLGFQLAVPLSLGDPADAERHIPWARDGWKAVQPYAAGAVYVNYLEAGQEGADRIRAAFGANYDRLR